MKPRGYYNLYKNYFEYLTECHPKLLQDKPDCKIIFEIVSIEEAFGDFRSTVSKKHFFFRLIEYTWGLSDDRSSNALQCLQGGFLIAGYHSMRAEGSDKYCKMMACTEEIALDFAEKMMDDSVKQHPLWYHSICTASNLNWTATPVRCVGDGTYSGWLVTFQWKSELHNCLPDHYDEKWKQPTPHTFE